MWVIRGSEFEGFDLVLVWWGGYIIFVGINYHVWSYLYIVMTWNIHS